jgi:hypothetical protein
MPKDKPVHIPLDPDVAVADFLKVKPTAEMPRPGKPKKAKTKKPAKKS